VPKPKFEPKTYAILARHGKHVKGDDDSDLTTVILIHADNFQHAYKMGTHIAKTHGLQFEARNGAWPVYPVADYRNQTLAWMVQEEDKKMAKEN